MEAFSLHDILVVFRRRLAVFALTTGLILALAVVFTFNWSRYRAVTTVQIEQADVAASAVAGNDAAPAVLADRRISQVQQKVMSVESLNKIMDTVGLYPQSKKVLSADKRAKAMRDSTRLTFISSEVANPAASQKESVDQLSAIAFNLSFDYSDPQLAKKGLDALVQAFIDEESSERRNQSQKTVDFLATELKVLEETIRGQELKIAEFKAKYGESGPSAVLFNQQAMLTNTMNLQSIESQLTANQSTIASLRAQLAAADPYAPVLEDGKMVNSPKGQKKALQSQYAALTGRYGQQHPDVVKLRAQLESLQAQPETTAYSAEREADNPLYLQLSAQLASAQGQQNGLLSQRAALKAQQDKYNNFAAKNPLVEKEMSQLSLDLENAKKRYAAMMEKKSTAEIRASIESGGNSTRLTVINPSTVPEGTSPSRKLLLVVGSFFALLAGLTMVLIVEMFSQAVRGANHLAEIVGVAPLVSIPYISAKQ